MGYKRPGQHRRASARTRKGPRLPHAGGQGTPAPAQAPQPRPPPSGFLDASAHARILRMDGKRRQRAFTSLRFFSGLKINRARPATAAPAQRNRSVGSAETAEEGENKPKREI